MLRTIRTFDQRRGLQAEKVKYVVSISTKLSSSPRRVANEST